ncbi:MAG: NAD-dependent epimerase/dehydratase family protein [Parvularculaceae bacterium]|nr:NAD-dependent epimerase/dehydratase family protein [Parvularculaceae bacterium]
MTEQCYSSIVREDVAHLTRELREVLPQFDGATVLITGASGFLMSYIVETLLGWNRSGAAKHCKIIALDNFKTGMPERLAHYKGANDLQFLKHDIVEPLALDEPIHYIVHGASIASPMVYRQFPIETIDANVGGTRNMLDIAREKSVRGIIIMSTSEIYGDPTPEYIPTPEDYRGNVSCTGPRACYDEGKRMAETLAMTWFRLYNTPIKLIRPFNIYGPGLRLNDQRVLPDFVSCALAGKSIELLSDGKPTRSFCYITDATALMIRVLVSDVVGEPLNVGNDEVEISMLDLARTVSRIGAKAIGRAPFDVRHAVSDDKDYLIDNPQRRCPSLEKARRLFPAWTPKVGIEEGIDRYIRHAMERGR